MYGKGVNIYSGVLWDLTMDYSTIFLPILTQTKAAFTRQYNKESHMTPYAAVAGAKKGRGRGSGGGGAGADAELLGEEGGDGTAVESDNEDSDNPDADAMIKVRQEILTVESVLLRHYIVWPLTTSFAYCFLVYLHWKATCYLIFRVI